MAWWQIESWWRCNGGGGYDLKEVDVYGEPQHPEWWLRSCSSACSETVVLFSFLNQLREQNFSGPNNNKRCVCVCGGNPKPKVRIRLAGCVEKRRYACVVMQNLFAGSGLGPPPTQYVLARKPDFRSKRVTSSHLGCFQTINSAISSRRNPFARKNRIMKRSERA